MSKPEYQDIINEYKEQVRILKQEVAELQDAGKSKDSANKRTLQKLEHVTTDLEEANKKIKELEENHDKNLILKQKTKNKLINLISECSGHTGIAGGQYLDLNYEKKKYL